MKRRRLQNQRWNLVLNVLVLTLFIGLGFARYSPGRDKGDDLSASYVGCRLVSEGLAVDHLYSHDATDFSAIGSDDTWQTAADEGEFEGYLHPYVQTPLWAIALVPLCKRTQFESFKRLFAVLILLAFASSIWMAARYWAPSLFNPIALSGILCVLWFSAPFQYAMFLMQTHVLFFVITIAALLLAKRQPVAAGLLLAIAATVKITPCLFIVYWLLTRQWRAAVWASVWCMVLWIVTVLAGGGTLTHLYLSELGRLSHTLLISQNNQSLAAWWMGRFYPLDEIYDVTSFPLPTAVRFLSSGLMMGCCLLGAAIDRRPRNADAVPAPFGAMIVLMAATVFAPIAWTHYSILLIAPGMILWQTALTRRSKSIFTMLGVVLALNFPPFATDVIHGIVGRFSILRGQFYAGLLTIAILAWVGLHRGESFSEMDTVHQPLT